MFNQKGVTTMVLVAIIAVVVLVGGGMAWYFVAQDSNENTNAAVSNTNSEVSNTNDELLNNNVNANQNLNNTINVNTNSSANTNTSVDSNLETFTSEFNFSFTYSDEWTEQTVTGGNIGNKVESVGFTPTTILEEYIEENGNDAFWLTIMTVYQNSDNLSPNEWFDQIISPATKEVINQSPIDGHTVYAAKLANDSYAGYEYIIEGDNSTLIRFQMVEEKTHYEPGGEIIDDYQDYTMYTTEFIDMVQSLKFTE
jgi:hypothetical protein